MSKIILLFLITFSFSSEWLVGNNNPNGKTGFLTIKPYFTKISSDDLENQRIRTTVFSMPLTDFMTFEYTRTTVDTRQDSNTSWDRTGGDGEAYLYFHLPLYKLWE